MSSTFISLPTPQVPLSSTRAEQAGNIEVPWLNYLKALDVNVRQMSTAADTAVTTLGANVRSRINRFNHQSFTATTVNSYTPTAGMKYALIIATGGGGGGGGLKGATTTYFGASGGGGAGGTAIALYTTATLGTSATVLVGSGGSGGTTLGAAGTDGADTVITFENTATALITAAGGIGGTTVSSGGGGGVPTGGSMHITGGSGNAGFCFDGLGGQTGSGGGSWWGGGGRNVTRLTSGFSQGGAAAVQGSGGAGAVGFNSTLAAAGANGGGGRVWILEFIASTT